MEQSRIHLAAVENADKRLKERPNTICAWADYDAGLIQGFKDGAKWAFGKGGVDMMDKREAKFWLESFYPTTIIQDRYNGTYSGAEWLAFPMDYYQVPREIDGDDIECIMFWESYNGEVGKGSTPELAMANLVAKMQGVSDKQFAQVHMTEYLKKGIKAFLMANGRYAGSSETAQILREIADEWDD